MGVAPSDFALSSCSSLWPRPQKLQKDCRLYPQIWPISKQGSCKKYLSPYLLGHVLVRDLALHFEGHDLQVDNGGHDEGRGYLPGVVLAADPDHQLWAGQDANRVRTEIRVGHK